MHEAVAPQDKSILLFEHRPEPSFGFCLNFWDTNCGWTQWYREGEDLGLSLPFGLSWVCATRCARAFACAACMSLLADAGLTRPAWLTFWPCVATFLQVAYSSWCLAEKFAKLHAIWIETSQQLRQICLIPCIRCLFCLVHCCVLYWSLLLANHCLTSDILFYNQIYQLLHYLVLAVALFLIRKEKLTSDEYFFRTVPLWGWIWYYM